jgi:hypothetical protein
MSTTTTDPTAAVKAQAEDIVASGTDIRPRLAEVVTQNAWRPQQPGGLIELIRAVADGAREGLARSVPQDREDVLRQVVDALTDGLSRAALAGRLALDEAASAFRQYTTEDLKRFSHDLLAVHDLFRETIERGLTTCKALTTTQVAAARTHIDRVSERLRTELKGLNDHVREHPEAFARESLRAGASMGRCAAGSLFEAIGRMLSRAGDELTRESEPSGGGGAAAKTKTKGKA